MRSTTTSLILTASIYLGQPTHAQLSSCADLGNAQCPFIVTSGGLTTCTVDNEWLDAVGVANITNSLAAEPLSWTVGYMPRDSRTDGKLGTDHLNFYLGQPPDLDLRQHSSVKACALFFDGIASKLNFSASEASVGASAAKGTCADALTAQCVNDWVGQVQKKAEQLDETKFTCQLLAKELRDDPPATCKIAKQSWGAVSGQDLTGPNMPLPLVTGRCSPTFNGQYSLTKVHQVNSSTEEMILTHLTPVFTGMKPLNGRTAAVDTTLSCLKPIMDNAGGPTDEGFQFQGGSGKTKSLMNVQMILSGLVLVFAFVL